MNAKAEVSFYHFTTTPLALGSSRLIKKIYDSKQNLLVLCKTEEEMNELDRALWTFASREFIPHGKASEANPELQPVLFSTDSHCSKNNAEVLLSFRDEMEDFSSSAFKKYLYVFYGNADEVQHMINSYREYKDREDVAAVFWQQDKSGKWDNRS